MAKKIKEGGITRGLEVISRVLTVGFGDRIIIGVIMGFWDGVSPKRAYEYIRDDIKLGYWITEENWQRYRRMAKQANIQAHIGEITKDRIITELRKRRPDLLSVIINHPEGEKWLQKQIDMFKEKLELVK